MAGGIEQMKIGLIDVDGHNYPNLALMKISAYEQQQGNDVEWCIGLKHYNKVYMAKVFDNTYSKDYEFTVQADEIIKGGTGYNMHQDLPKEIEHMMPDYRLYGITDTAYGFLTRGCPRNCQFCIVGEKEGLVSHKVADISEFWQGQKNIELLDANLLASKDCDDLLEQLADTGALVNFSQGLDVRFIDSKKCELLEKINIKYIHFAYDNYPDEITESKLQFARKQLSLPERQLRVYVLTNFNTKHEEDLYRINWLKDNGFDPYVMIFNKPAAPKETKYLQRWCNDKKIFRTVSFEEYDHTIG